MGGRDSGFEMVGGRYTDFGEVFGVRGDEDSGV
jgi:hypothetical protein